MMMIERYRSGHNPLNVSVCRCQRGKSGYWQRAWVGEDWDDEAREIAQMCNTNGDPMRVTFGSDRVRQ